MDFYNIQKSPLTKSTETFPTYLLENERLFVKPDTITGSINCDFLRKPLDPRWGYSIGLVGQYVYDPTIYGPLLLNTGNGTLTSSITTQLAGGDNGTYTPTFTGGSGTGLILTATVNSPTTVSVGVTTAGTGYVVGDVITVTAGQLGTTTPSTGPVITLTEANFNANSTYGSTQIELDVSEQTSFILKR